MQGCIGGQRAARAVDLDAHIVSMGHIGDLLDLGDAAAVADIGLSQLKQVLLEILCILPARVQTLAVCDGHGAVLGNVFNGLGGGRVGLLKGHDVILFCQLCQLHSSQRIRVGVVLHDDVHIVAGGFTGGLHAGFYHLQLFWSQQAGGIQEVEGLAFFITIKEIDLDRVKAFVQCQLDVVCVIRGGHSPQVFGNAHLAPAKLQLACVGAELIANLAAQQLVAGNIEILAFDVPQSYIDGCDAGEDDRAAVLAPERPLVHGLPDELSAKRIHTDDQLCQIADHAKCAGTTNAVGHAGFTVTTDADVRMDPASDGTVLLAVCSRQAEHLDLCNLHRIASFFYRQGQLKRSCLFLPMLMTSGRISTQLFSCSLSEL